MNRVSMPKSLVVTTVVALVAVIAASIVGWGSLGSLTDQGDAGEDTAMLSGALAISQHSNSLASAGLVETNLRMTRESVLEMRSDIADAKDQLSTQVSGLMGRGHDERVSRIEDHVNSLIAIVDEVDGNRPDLLRNIVNDELKRRELSSSTTRILGPAIMKSIDDQFYYMMTGRSDVRDTPSGADTLSPLELERFQHMTELQRGVSVAHSMLAAVVRATDPTLITTVQEAFDSSAQGAKANLEFLSANGGPELDPRVIPLVTALIEAGSGSGNYFDAVEARLEMSLDERALIASSEGVLSAIDSEIAALVADVNAGIVSSADDSEQAAASGQTTVLIVGIIGIVIVLLVAGYLGSRKQEG